MGGKIFALVGAQGTHVSVKTDSVEMAQFLIETGHRREDIANYPLSVFKGFQRAAQKSHSRQRKALFNIVAEAMHGNSESRKAFWKDLGNG